MTLVESVKKNKEDYNAAIDSTIAQINATRTATNTSFEATIDQLTKVAADFPASIVVA